MQILGIIPARYASSRFPGKPLVDIDGKTMIQRVYEQARLSQLDKVIVATDDQRIYEHVLGFGGQVCMTNKDHPSGTDRCAEVARTFKDFPLVLNIQGDEPFIQPEQINRAISLLKNNADAQIGTLIKKIELATDLFNPNVVKAVIDNQNKALYFSRSPIPYLRSVDEKEWLIQHTYYKHIGLYVFQRKVLLEIANLQATKLEKAESLEQLRWLENGYHIVTAVTTKETIGIDTPEDLKNLKNRI